VTHKVIYLIVEAIHEKEAWVKGNILRELLIEENIYDYGKFFNEDSPVSGASRWGQLVPIARLDTTEGNQLLQDGLNSIKRQFLDALKNAKETMEEYNDEELYYGKVTDSKSLIIEGLKDIRPDYKLFLFRHNLANMCDDKRYGWIYILRDNIEDVKDNYFEGIDNHTDFERTININYRDHFWIMPLDVHF